MRDTIAAIATATGGGVGMVRLSGPQALAVAGRVFRPMNPAKSPETMPGYTGAFGRVCHGEQLLDEAVLFVYHAPHSYTGEDVAEFCCHGGEFVLSQVLAAVIAAGARPAEAGEYTRRALMNGRMTLTEAESVIDILAAQNTQSLRAALGAMEGALHREVLAAADPDASQASWAYRFCLDLPGVLTVLAGASTLEQMRDNMATFQSHAPLTEAERGAIDGAIAALRSVDLIPCTNCGYCVKDCPEGVKIPIAMNLLNLEKTCEDNEFVKGLYSWQAAEGPASKCIQCGTCEAMCPQSIAIIDHLAEAVEHFEG